VVAFRKKLEKIILGFLSSSIIALGSVGCVSLSLIVDLIVNFAFGLVE
jgi:hypothetical protein